MSLFSADIDALSLLAQAAADAPQIDGMFAVRLLSRIFHIMFAVILGGGLFYLRAVLAPAGVDACYAGRRAVWARWVGIATLFLIGSGLFNYITFVREAKAMGDPLPSAYHMLFGIKFLLALFVFFMAAILAGKTSLADKLRANMAMWLNLTWTAVMAIIIIGALMRTYH
ncbi:hypothetical protein [Lacipirellula parvula]|uniref:Copper resistance protein D domain-containing protein n=1 Tax=Lacipirellula parvula TaxID=2650471 RepID=A0A5K7X895_9BACT|nr:hypothetical protein [Lacipirellula parvula]BBO32037.1 hypothetical protein PLANPX_1649 [Lacipirellula parvula]